MEEYIQLTQEAGIGACMGCTTEGEYLYVISNADQYRSNGFPGGCLRVLSIKEPLHPRLISVVDHLGAVRQLIVRNGYAYISAR